ncbi:MAG: hypothetical protein ABIK82_22685 [Pseudomonadota bacterium]
MAPASGRAIPFQIAPRRAGDIAQCWADPGLDYQSFMAAAILFECMGMGIPVLHGVAGESAEIVEQEGCGQVFVPEDVDALCAGLLALKADDTLRQRYCQNGLAAACRYDRKELALRMLAEIEACR